MTLQQDRQFEEFASDVARGLAGENKAINSKYLYDKVGSQLFVQICVQPEYYLTRIETSILDKHAYDIMRLTGTDISLIELGSGSSSKTTILLGRLALQKKRTFYFPIDISRSALIESAQRLKSQFPTISVIEIPSDYDTGFERVAKYIAEAEDNEMPERKLVVFLGSSIGNFELAQAKSLFQIVREKLDTNDFFLVGFDLQKDKSVLNSAYNDKAGMTAKFNLNLLARINRELDGKFHLGKFDHHAFYNEDKQRIEMHLLSKTEHQVYVSTLDRTFSFRKGETIHTENSYKYSLDQIAMLAKDSGFVVKKHFTDKKEWFDLALFSPS